MEYQETSQIINYGIQVKFSLSFSIFWVIEIKIFSQCAREVQHRMIYNFIRLQSLKMIE